MIRTVIIVDDEPLARTNLCKLIENFTDWKVILELDSGYEIEKHAEEYKPDLIFLDIKMPKRDGISAAAGLLAVENPPLVVFVSAYSDYALQAFELCALDYLLKPFSDERFKQTVARLNSLSEKWDVIQKIQQLQIGSISQKQYIKMLVIRSVGVIQIVDLKDVIWFQGSGNYVEVMLEKEKYLHRVSLSFLEDNLDPKEFVRCHRSAIVRLSSIREIKTIDEAQFLLVLENGDTAKLSQTYKEAILKRIEC